MIKSVLQISREIICYFRAISYIVFFVCFRIVLFFFFSFFFISWRLITLQYCNGFCHTLTWISHGVTCIPHPDTSLSTRFLWVFPVHQAWALVLCIPPGLVICFTIDNIHVLMLFSRNINLQLLVYQIFRWRKKTRKTQLFISIILE